MSQTNVCVSRLAAFGSKESWRRIYVSTRERTTRNAEEKLEIVMGNQNLIFFG